MSSVGSNPTLSAQEYSRSGLTRNGNIFLPISEGNNRIKIGGILSRYIHYQRGNAQMRRIVILKRQHESFARRLAHFILMETLPCRVINSSFYPPQTHGLRVERTNNDPYTSDGL